MTTRVVGALRMRKVKEIQEIIANIFVILKMPLSTLINEAVSC